VLDETTRERLRREVKRLVLAESDMSQVAVAAEHLSRHGAKMNSQVVRVLWTGIAVTYARPFSKANTVGPVEGRLVRLEDPMQRSLHGRLCELRNQLFAHTDETELRGIVDVAALLSVGTGGYAEEHASMNMGALPDIVKLANDWQHRFAARLTELEEQLGDTRT
jgi:hypothetical protein